MLRMKIGIFESSESISKKSFLNMHRFYFVKFDYLTRKTEDQGVQSGRLPMPCTSSRVIDERCRERTRHSSIRHLWKMYQKRNLDRKRKQNQQATTEDIGSIEILVAFRIWQRRVATTKKVRARSEDLVFAILMTVGCVRGY